MRVQVKTLITQFYGVVGTEPEMIPWFVALHKHIAMPILIPKPPFPDHSTNEQVLQGHYIKF